jgi:hypothetical protein
VQLRIASERTLLCVVRVVASSDPREWPEVGIFKWLMAALVNWLYFGG